jgi:hypothetical protein
VAVAAQATKAKQQEAAALSEAAKATVAAVAAAEKVPGGGLHSLRSQGTHALAVLQRSRKYIAKAKSAIKKAKHLNAKSHAGVSALNRAPAAVQGSAKLDLLQVQLEDATRAADAAMREASEELAAAPPEVAAAVVGGAPAAAAAAAAPAGWVITPPAFPGQVVLPAEPDEALRVQFGPPFNTTLAVKQSELQKMNPAADQSRPNWGLFAVNTIPKDHKIAPYEGELMTEAQFKQRYPPAPGSKKSSAIYAYCSGGLCQDAADAMQSTVGRYANTGLHLNNATLRGNPTGKGNSQRLRPYLISTARIPAGREIFTAYSSGYSLDPADREFLMELKRRKINHLPHN